MGKDFAFTIGIVIVSDKGSRGEREDKSGPTIEKTLNPVGGIVKKYDIVPDEIEAITSAIKEMADELHIDLILTSGGTGFSPRDNTPEATLEVIDRLVPGIPEIMRSESFKITPKAMLSRAVAGIRKNSLIINLPGSPKAVKESLDILIPVIEHGVEILRGDATDCARH